MSGDSSGEIFGIYGAAGHGRDIMPVARESLRARDISADRLVFIDDAPNMPETINGQRVMTFEAFQVRPADRRYVAISISDGAIRARLAAKLEANGIAPLTVIAPNTVIMDDVALGPGALLSPFVTLTYMTAVAIRTDPAGYWST